MAALSEQQASPWVLAWLRVRTLQPASPKSPGLRKPNSFSSCFISSLCKTILDLA
jgi:hypothetical protein